MNSILISLLLCTLLSFSAADDLSKNTIQVVLLSGSKGDKIVVAVQNAEVDTIAVLMKDSSSDASWVSMHYNDDADAWVVRSEEDLFEFPLSFTLISEDKENVIVNDVVGSMDTGIQYTPAHPNAPRRHKRPTSSPTKAPTQKPPATQKPATQKPATQAPVTQKPVTQKPVTPTTTKTPSSSGGSGLKLMVPLYTYPGASWTAVAAGASKVHTVAIINPNSGPGSGPDSTYQQYMSTLRNAGVELVGYVHTSYGARAIADVKADINKYASEYPLVVGIFIDEAAATADQVSYYTQVHNYIMSMPGYKYNILNPGTAPTSSYMSISTQIVTFEDSVSKFSSSGAPSYANSGNKDHFSVITYGASASQMQSAVATAKSKGYYGWVYVTDRTDVCCIYNTLSTYYAQQVSYIASL